MTGFAPETWDWASGFETLVVETSGVHTLTVWMREDGFRLDRLLLTTDTNYIPTSFGPAENEQQGTGSGSLVLLDRTIVYTYDNLYRLTEADYSTGEHFGYAYDPMGNQTAITETLESTTVTTYTYNAANQLATARASDDGIVWHYTHDANGNLLRQTPGGADPAEGETRYSYDAANRLVQVELYTGGSYTLLSEATYNGDGERVALTTYALGVPQTVSYVVGQDSQLLVADDGSEQTFYLHGRSLIAEYGSGWSYPLNDGAGSVRQTVDEAGVVTLARSYKPFGDTLQEEGAYETAFGFMGTQLDRLSGLLYANGRYYDPSTGRYLTPERRFDPYRPGTLNPYAPWQGPGLWLLVPLIGIVALRRRRKDGPWRMLVLMCVVGVGLSLTGCVVEIKPVETPTPSPVLPTQPTSTYVTSTPYTPTGATSMPPSPTYKATPIPSPTPCPTPPETPTPSGDHPARITREEIAMAGGMLNYLRSEPPERVMTRVALGESPDNEEDRKLVMWTIRVRAEWGYWGGIKDVVLASGPSSKPGEAGYQYDVVRLIDQVFDPRAEAVEGVFTCGHPQNLMIYPCDNSNDPDSLDDKNLQKFQDTENLAKTIIGQPVNREALMEIGFILTEGDNEEVIDSFSGPPCKSGRIALAGGNCFYSQFDGDDYLASQ